MGISAQPRFRLWAMLRSVLLLTVALLLAGCEESEPDLKQFVTKIKARPVPALAALPTPKPYRPIPYELANGRNPFAPVALIAVQPVKRVSILQPDLRREKEELEQFSLSSLRLVGTLQQKGQLVGLVNTPDNEVVVVRIGNHMGENFGRIESVGDDGLNLREIVKDADGVWEERLTRFGFEE